MQSFKVELGTLSFEVIGSPCNINLQKSAGLIKKSCSCSAIKLEIKFTCSNFYFTTYKNTQELIGNTSRTFEGYYYRLQILLFSHDLHIVYIGILICIGTLRNNVRNKDKKKLKD